MLDWAGAREVVQGATEALQSGLEQGDHGYAGESHVLCKSEREREREREMHQS